MVDWISSLDSGDLSLLLSSKLMFTPLPLLEPPLPPLEPPIPPLEPPLPPLEPPLPPLGRPSSSSLIITSSSVRPFLVDDWISSLESGDLSLLPLPPLEPPLPPLGRPVTLLAPLLTILN